MSKLDDIIDGGEYEITSASYKQQIKDLMLELIGDGEMHVSHVCPQDSIACREFQARSAFRNLLRQRINEL